MVRAYSTTALSSGLCCCLLVEHGRASSTAREPWLLETFPASGLVVGRRSRLGHFAPAAFLLAFRLNFADVDVAFVEANEAFLCRLGLWGLGRMAHLVYNAPLRPSDGMADVAVSKTVVERRASSNLASGTILIAKDASASFFLLACESSLTDGMFVAIMFACA